MPAEAIDQLYMAGFLLLWSVAMFSWTICRPTARAGVLRHGSFITLFGAGCYAVAGLLPWAEQPDWAQTLFYNVRAVPFMAAVGYIGYVLAANQAKKSPTLEAMCASAPRVLGTFWILVVVLGLLFPSPVFEETAPTAPSFVVLKLRNLAEFFFLAVSGIVFAKEVVRRQDVPSSALRIQHATLCLGSICFSLLVLNSFATALARSLNLPDRLDAPITSLHDPVQQLTLAAGGLAYMVGLFLYESGQENVRIIALLRKWIQRRHDLETSFDAAGNRVGNRFTEHYFHKAADDPAVALTPQERENAAYMVKLLAHLDHQPESRGSQIASLSRLQSELSRTNDVASRLFVKIEGNARYDIREDALYAAMTPALILAQRKARHRLVGEKGWVQLAAITAADAGHLPPEQKEAILGPNASLAKGSILEAYSFAKLTEEDT